MRSVRPPARGYMKFQVCASRGRGSVAEEVRDPLDPPRRATRDRLDLLYGQKLAYASAQTRMFPPAGVNFGERLDGLLAVRVRRRQRRGRLEVCFGQVFEQEVRA